MPLPFRFLLDGGGGGGGVTPPPGAVADFTFTADSTAEPLPTSGVAVTGDAEVATGLTINRIRWDGSTLRMNRTGGTSWSTWAAGDGAGLTFTVTVAGTPVALAVSAATSTAGQIRWTPDAAALAILDTIAAGTAMRVVVA